ncbi:hypothetical protein MHPYR_510047 [uncultured Mycobacterium sp.]|uniref:Uncharacterized protein n=1 Tax=uncultured Mycobacterium sp. TaxID=171292 RepID=A0A1Y5PHM8_9MYCO|nr:hypothetical protein MHPYR_510047 [uncultured Mycobacterium sp.]
MHPAPVRRVYLEGVSTVQNGNGVTHITRLASVQVRSPLTQQSISGTDDHYRSWPRQSRRVAWWPVWCFAPQRTRLGQHRRWPNFKGANAPLASQAIEIPLENGGSAIVRHFQMGSANFEWNLHLVL